MCAVVCVGLALAPPRTLRPQHLETCPGPSTLADRDLLSRRVQGQVGTARPERRLYTQCAAGQEAKAEHPTYI